jgi:hypothetical protein
VAEPSGEMSVLVDTGAEDDEVAEVEVDAEALVVEGVEATMVCTVLAAAAAALVDGDDELAAL